MRILSLVVALSVLAALALGQVPCTPANQSSSSSLSPPNAKAGDELQMRSRSRIQVIPIDLLVSNNAELESLRAGVVEAEAEANKLEIPDPAIREQFSRHMQLLRSLLHLADRQRADTHKSPTALEVQERLNNIEGQSQCEACHGKIVLRSHVDSGPIGLWRSHK